MMICVLGRQPAIGLAELEGLYGSKSVRAAGSSCALVDAEVDFDRLGSSIKTAHVLTTIDSTNPQNAYKAAVKLIPELVELLGDGKVKLGVSHYDLSMPISKINSNNLSLKKAIRTLGRSVRVVPNQTAELSSAQVFHNSLTGPVGIELLFVKDGDSIVIARTSAVQDIDAYTLRDRSRPKRDAFVGMLPPKLAQTIINLAVGDQEQGKIFTVLDPFCGTGVVLMEASLMGYSIYGTDLSEKMVRYSRDNMNWLQEKRSHKTDVLYEVADAVDHIWRLPVDIVACEGYLGQPLGGQSPSPDRLQKIIGDCDNVMRGFLKNIASQLPTGTRLCIAMPAWHIGVQINHLPVLHDLQSLGYTRQVFTHATNDELIYRREDQITGRELVVLTTN